MALERFLSEKRTRIIRKWQEDIIGSYPSQTQRFLRREKDPFSNPVGHILSKDIEILFDEVVRGEDREKIRSSLDHIIRIRAVQEFKPSHAVAFVLRLKGVIKKTLEEKGAASGYAAELGALSVDHLEQVTPNGVEKLQKFGSVATLLPGSVFFIGSETYPPARRLMEAGVPVALATDCNPGSSFTESMPFVIGLAVLNMQMTPAEALVGATLNSAYAIGMADKVGSLDKGKQADFLLLR